MPFKKFAKGSIHKNKMYTKIKCIYAKKKLEHEKMYFPHFLRLNTQKKMLRKLILLNFLSSHEDSFLLVALGDDKVTVL